MTDWRIEVGDCRDVLRTMPTGSVHTVVTSPPYFGLRDYGTGEWEGGDPAWQPCKHIQRMARKDSGRPATEVPRGAGGEMVPSGSSTPTETPLYYSDVCGKCGACRVHRQIGLEPTPDKFVATLVEVFREVRRVLRDDGTVWLNLGDSYVGGGGYSPGSPSNVARQEALANGNDRDGAFVVRGEHNYTPRRGTGSIEGAKPKDLLGIPWMVAFALRADGWHLRSDIIWSKPNPMPESVTDRPTKAHEYVFLLSKGPRYFYDADAIREDAEPSGWAKQRAAGVDTWEYGKAAGGTGVDDTNGVGGTFGPGGRNKRSVWTVATQPYAGAHFATFPSKLVEPMILAGAPERACGECGAPWVRVVERIPTQVTNNTTAGRVEALARPHGQRSRLDVQTLGFEPSCFHGDGSARGVVLDPFAGAGTTGLVALQHGREFVGIELSPAYARMARERIETAVRLGFRSPQNGGAQLAGQLDIFGDTA